MTLLETITEGLVPFSSIFRACDSSRFFGYLSRKCSTPRRICRFSTKRCPFRASHCRYSWPTCSIAARVTSSFSDPHSNLPPRNPGTNPHVSDAHLIRQGVSCYEWFELLPRSHPPITGLDGSRQQGASEAEPAEHCPYIPFRSLPNSPRPGWYSLHSRMGVGYSTRYP